MSNQHSTATRTREVKNPRGDLGRQLALDFEAEAEDWRTAQVEEIFGPWEHTGPEPEPLAEQEARP